MLYELLYQQKEAKKLEVNMKRYSLIFIIWLLPAFAFSQFKKDQTELPNIRQSIAKPTSNVFFGLINPDKMSMHHSFSASYMTVGGKGLMLNSYMNTINYQLSNPLYLRLNLGLINSPYNSFNNNSLFNEPKFFGSAELQYRPSENMRIKVGVDVSPGYNFMRSPYSLEED